MSNALLTCLELIVGVAIVMGFVYEKKLIAFEDRIVLLVKKFLRKRGFGRVLRLDETTRARHCA